jgi:hypothetical protein
LNEALLTAALYLRAVDLKSACNGQQNRWTRLASPFRHATFTIRYLTLAAPWIIDCSTMSVTTVKRLIKRAPKQKSRMRRSFGGLARQFAHESNFQFAIEGILFAVLLAVSALPIFAAVDAIK